MSLVSRLENIRQLAHGGVAGCIPFTLDVGGIPGFTVPILERFRRETEADDPAEYFDYDFRVVSLQSHFSGDDPAALHDSVEPGTTFDEWGIGHWAGGAEGTYEKAYAPLARADSVTDVEALPSPAIADTTGANTTISRYHERDYPVCGYAGSVYEWSWWLRGMEQLMMDLVLAPELVEAITRKVAAFTTRLALASARAGIDVLCFYDDAGMQTGMQISPELWRRFIKPRWSEILGSVRGEFPDAIFFLHSCGKIDEIVPDIVEVGFHILHPVQPECMAFAEIYHEFGRDIVLSASLSSQKVLPFGAPEEVRAEVQRLRAVCSPDNRAMFVPSNLIQPETPWENIVAFAEEASRERR